MTDTEKEMLIKTKGWFSWYNAKYWYHSQFDSDKRDCTNWGMSVDEAYRFETDPESRKKTLAGMNLISHGQQILSNLGTRSKSAR